MITGIGAPSKIKPCGQQYMDLQSGLKYNQSKCPSGNIWNLIDTNSSNDNSTPPSTPSNLGQHIYSETFTLDFTNMVDSFNSPFLLKTLTNTGITDCAMTIIQATSLFTGTRFSSVNNPILKIGTTEVNSILNGFFYLVVAGINDDDNPSQGVISQWTSGGYSQTILAGQTMDLYFQSSALLGDGDITTQLIIYLNYVLNY